MREFPNVTIRTDERKVEYLFDRDMPAVAKDAFEEAMHINNGVWEDDRTFSVWRKKRGLWNFGVPKKRKTRRSETS